MLEYPKEVYGIVIPAVTNTTACQIGFFSGWKNWCSNHAVDCVQNITRGDFPPIILQLHEQYLRGYNEQMVQEIRCAQLVTTRHSVRDGTKTTPPLWRVRLRRCLR